MTTEESLLPLPNHEFPDSAEHPGELLRQELDERGMSASELAAAIGRPGSVVADFLNGKRPMSAEFALLLSPILGTSPEFWMNLQSRYDLTVAYNRLRTASAT